jgi:hypothetical protein
VKPSNATPSCATSSPATEPTQLRERDDMRFMMLMIPKGYETATPGTMPDAKAVPP